MKNVTIIETAVNKNRSWKLINDKGEELSFFNIFETLLFKLCQENLRFYRYDIPAMNGEVLRASG